MILNIIILLVLWTYDNYFMPMIVPDSIYAYHDIYLCILWWYVMSGDMLALYLGVTRGPSSPEYILCGRDSWFEQSRTYPLWT